MVLRQLPHTDKRATDVPNMKRREGTERERIYIRLPQKSSVYVSSASLKRGLKIFCA